MSKYGIYLNSRPCNNCIFSLRKSGIKKIIYTTGDEQIYKIENVQTIKPTHESSGSRYKSRLKCM
jgi:deoxycytidylate deaminase